MTYAVEILRAAQKQLAKIDRQAQSRIIASLQRVIAAHGHDVDTVISEGIAGQDDAVAWRHAGEAGRFLITQDLDFSDIRRFAPGTHHGILLVRLRDPGLHALRARS